MKKFRKSFVKVEDLQSDDFIKIAGILYRVTRIEIIGDAYLIQFRNVRRPLVAGLLTFEKNTLMTIWNQK